MNKFFEKLNELINEYNDFIVIGHKDPDMDSLGSCLGLYQIIEQKGKNVNLFLEDKSLIEYNSNINQAFSKLEKSINCINSKDLKKISKNSLLIILDVHSKERIEYPKLVDLFDVAIIDHHIKSKNYIKDTKLLYLDSNLSSVSELIAYYAEYLNIELDPVIATILLAGIEIDTNSFNLKTTNRTYLSASLLMEMGADSILKQELLKETKEEYMKRASHIKNSFMATDNIAMCIINTGSSSLELANVAEELLNFEDVEASFVIGKISNDEIGISARSIGDIDVANIMEQMGGGGHFSNAACQIKNKTIKEVKLELLDIIK